MNYPIIEANIAFQVFNKYHLMINNLPESVSVEDTFKATISVPHYLLGVFYEQALRRPKPQCNRLFDECIGEYIIKQTEKDEIIIKHELLDFISSLTDVSNYKILLLDLPPQKYNFCYSDDTETMNIPINDLQTANQLMLYFLKQKIIQNNESVLWVDSFHPSFTSLGHGLYFKDDQGKLRPIWKNGESKVIFRDMEMFYERNAMFVEFKEDTPQFTW